MKTFRNYFVELNSDEKNILANKANTSVAYLYQLSSGHRQAGWKTIQNLISADSRISYEMFSKAQTQAA